MNYIEMKFLKVLDKNVVGYIYILRNRKDFLKRYKSVNYN